MQGSIDPRALTRLEKAILSGEISRIRLSSPGGIVNVAHRLGVLIRDNNIDTYVGSDDECSSACVILLASGVNRHAEEGAHVGLHSVYHTNRVYLQSIKPVDLYRDAQELTAYHLIRTLAFIDSEYHLGFIRLQLHAHHNSTTDEMYFTTNQELKEAGIID